MYISIDLGGTNTRVASSEDLISFVLVEKFLTEPSLANQKEKVVQAIKNVSHNARLDGVSIGVPGQIDFASAKFKFITNIPFLSGVAYSGLIGDVECKVIGQNDTSLAGLAEAVRGAGVGYDVVAYITLSTGVGGARIIQGKLNDLAKHNEPGHMIIHPEGRYLDTCGQNGCFEAYCSGKSFSQLYNIEAAECTDKDLWAKYASDLALGLTNVIAMWSPDIIVLGGSVVHKFDDYFKAPLLENLSQQKVFSIPPIVKAKLGDDAGLYGGLISLKN